MMRPTTAIYIRTNGDSHTTYKYLGINIDDMNDAMKILRDFDKG